MCRHRRDKVIGKKQRAKIKPQLIFYEESDSIDGIDKNGADDIDDDTDDDTDADTDADDADDTDTEKQI